ncbi:unnamed protein product (macronuclear) [Paramecium tetraurelia]|uniref:Uncharacterized protein n=2 Tax=Paramecium TaxID=5884 RepID=A0CS90_PARTE|nr:uncharacterized protein GSPATT00009929001 [Paramecium tetraurelia]CAD8165389.1 unnamed protein product [Paramecium octaurelia]CAK73657.1 unnamed protein product [Paramecium tetraurelia]|eukprot:XP_001441054.1 hypothetical protein (macronuclear) [Paramecium tetraurelia strain d4-2]
MSYKPRPENKLKQDQFTKEIKPNNLPNNILNISNSQEIYFNTKGYYQDLQLRIQCQKTQLDGILEKSLKILDEEQQKQQYEGII